MVQRREGRCLILRAAAESLSLGFFIHCLSRDGDSVWLCAYKNVKIREHDGGLAHCEFGSVSVEGWGHQGGWGGGIKGAGVGQLS